MNGQLISIAISLALATQHCDARERPTCGDLELQFERVVKQEKERPHYFAELTLVNKQCRPAGFTTEISGLGRLWFRDQHFVRWEHQAPGSSQWVSYVGYSNESRPTKQPNLTLQSGERRTVYVQINSHDILERPAGTKFRLFLTDASGVSRSTSEIDLSNPPTPPQPLQGTDLANGVVGPHMSGERK